MMVRLLVILMFFISCSEKVEDVGDTVYKDGKLYLKNSNILYTGNLISKHKNGKIASKFTYKDGILYGEWSTHGYDGELIQNGEYIQNTTLDTYLDSFENFKNWSLSWSKEGQFSWMILDVVVLKSSNKLPSDSVTNYIVEKYLSEYKKDYYEIKFYQTDSLISRKIIQ